LIAAIDSILLIGEGGKNSAGADRFSRAMPHETTNP